MKKQNEKVGAGGKSKPVSATATAPVPASATATATSLKPVTAQKQMSTPKPLSASAPTPSLSPSSAPSSPTSPNPLPISNSNPASSPAAKETALVKASNTPSSPASNKATPTSKPAQGQAQKTKVVTLGSQSEVDAFFDQNVKNLIFIDFHAKWCSPCKIIANLINEMAEKYEKKAVFAKIDVDDLEDYALAVGVETLPALLITKGRERIEMIYGSDLEKLRAAIEKHVKSGKD